MNELVYRGKTYTDQIKKEYNEVDVPRLLSCNSQLVCCDSKLLSSVKRENRLKSVSGDDLISCFVNVLDSIVSDSIGSDTMYAVVQDEATETKLLSSGGVLLAAGGVLLTAQREFVSIEESYEYASPVTYRHKGNVVGEFYLDEITQIGKNKYEISAVSAVGILISSYFYGGMYAGEKCGDVISKIVSGIVPYSIDNDIASIPVYGWIKKSTRRDALKNVLFSVGAQISKDIAGKLSIIKSGSNEPYEINSDNIYIEGSVTGGKPATGVQVTEHAYVALESADRDTLFDGYAAAASIVTPAGASVVGVLVEFNDPYFDLQATGCSILESGVNYAVISSSAAAVLTGIPYTHTTRIVSRTTQTRKGQAQNVVTCSTCYLVNPLNSERVADRLMAYYGSAKTISTDIVLTTQKPGDAVTLTNPFGKAASGYIRSLDMVMSGIIKARAEIVTGYTPVPSGNNYTTSELITQSGQWTAQKDGTILVYLISGGYGGSIGEPGEDGGDGSASSMGAYGAGGEPGEGGAGGRVAVYMIQVKAGQTFPITIGAGGTGQTLTAAATAGGDTTFGAYSSASGASSPGVTDPTTAAVYGQSGQAGIAGARGGGVGEGAGDPELGSAGPPLIYDGETYYPGETGTNYPPNEFYKAYGGYGGGAAVGANGEDGVSTTSYNRAGNGGDGATPVKPPAATTPGQGGQGGHGGGGGGGGGANSYGNPPRTPGDGGLGGQPGPAGDGASGAVLILS